MSVHTKAARKERFRLHAQDYHRRTPGWARIFAKVALPPEAWQRFAELLIPDDEPTINLDTWGDQ